MPAGDLALRMLITADATGAVAAVGLVGTHLLGLSSIFPSIKNGLGNIAFGLRNLGTAGTIGMDALTQGAVQAGQGFFKLGLALAGIAAVALLALGGVAVHAAADFQAAMTRLVTSAGELPKNLQMISDGILNLSVSTGTSYQQLAAGMYYVESSGYRAGNALRVLQVAAQGAKSENADLTTVSKALTTVMTDYHMPVTQAAAAMNGLIATVQNGKTNLQELSASMGAVLPIASALHISFPQVAGAMDTMTNAGMSSRQAAMNLAHVLVALQAPSGVATKSMKEVGLSAQQVRDALVHQGLPQALQLIEDHVGKKFPEGSVANTTALKNIMGGLVGLKLAAMLTGGSLKETESNISKVSAAMKHGGQSVMGWSEVQSTFNFKMDQAKNAVQALFIKIGTALLPVVSNLVSNVTPLITGFTNWLTTGGHLQAIIGFLSTAFTFLGNTISKVIQIGMAIVNFFRQNEVAGDALKATLILIGIVVGTVLVIAFLAAAKAVLIFTLSLLTNPIVWIVIAIIAVITGIILVITHWGAIMTWVGNVMSAVGTFIHGVLSAIGAWFGSVFSAIGTTVHNAMTGIKNTVGNVFSAIGTFIHNLITGFQNLGGAFNIVKLLLIIVFLPFIVIIGLIIVIIHHWGAIMAWFGGLFSAIGSGIHSHLVELGKGFSDLGTSAHKVVTAIGGVFSWLGGIAHAALSKVGDAFSWLGTQAHNFIAFIQPALHAVGGAFSGLGGIAHAALGKVGDFFSMLGSGAHAAVTAIGNFFHMIGNFLSPIVNFATMVVHWFTWLWDTLVGHSIIPEMIAAIGRAFLKLLSNIPIVGGMVQGVIGLFSHMADAITNKTEQLRIAQQQKLVQMRLDTDKQTMLGAAAAIANLEHERVGILEKLKTCHSQAERNELEYQLKMTDTQIQNQQKRLQEAEKDKNAQLAKQKELHNQALEAQKWFGQRFLDMMGSWIGDQFNKLGTMVSGWMSKLGQWKDQAVTKATEMVTNFTNMIAELPGKVGGWIANMATTVLSKLASLASDALSAGANIVKNIASGIIGAIGSFLGNAMSQVGSFIHDHLPHSPAKRGPLRDLPYQGAMISKQIADGIVTGMPHIQRAMLALSSEMIKGTVLSGTQAQLGGNAFTPSGARNAFALSGSSGQTILIQLQPQPIMLDNKKVGESVGQTILKETRINGLRR